jgi:hypothetical protein
MGEDDVEKEKSEPQIVTSKDEDGGVTVTVTYDPEEKEVSTPRRRGRPSRQAVDENSSPIRCFSDNRFRCHCWLNLLAFIP